MVALYGFGAEGVKPNSETEWPKNGLQNTSYKCNSL